MVILMIKICYINLYHLLLTNIINLLIIYSYFNKIILVFIKERSTRTRPTRALTVILVVPTIFSVI